MEGAGVIGGAVHRGDDRQSDESRVALGDATAIGEGPGAAWRRAEGGVQQGGGTMLTTGFSNLVDMLSLSEMDSEALVVVFSEVEEAGGQLHLVVSSYSKAPSTLGTWLCAQEIGTVW
ncbi:hypothetical protein ABZP36_020362 [Zizania latifolia]